MTSPDDCGNKKLSEHQLAVLDKLQRQVREKLAVLQEPDARAKIEAVMKSRGKLSGLRPKAGDSY